MRKKIYLVIALLVGVISAGSIYVVLTGQTPTRQIATARLMPHSPEYNSVVEQHIDTSQISRQEVDSAAIRNEVSKRFVLYYFDHDKLRGKWGDLYVFVDRQLGKTTSRSLLPVHQKQPEITVKDECLSVPQIKDGLVRNYEICVR